MRIALNAQLLSEPRSGTGRYIYNLLDALGRLDSSSEYRILSHMSAPRASAGPGKHALGGHAARRPCSPISGDGEVVLGAARFSEGGAHPEG